MKQDRLKHDFKPFSTQSLEGLSKALERAHNREAKCKEEGHDGYGRPAPET